MEDTYNVNGTTHAPADGNERINAGLGYSKPALTGRHEDLLSASALLNDDSFHQYVWMSDASSLSQNIFGEAIF